MGKDFEAGEFIGVPGIATAPVWPFRALILVGVTLAAIEFVLRVWGALRRASARTRASLCDKSRCRSTASTSCFAALGKPAPCCAE